MATTEIQLLHFGIRLNLARRAFLEDGPLCIIVTLDDAERDIHVVLDDDVADVARQRGEDRDQIAALMRRETRRRLVEQNKARRAGERERDLELPLLARANSPTR